jgi:hypothetical protein
MRLEKVIGDWSWGWNLKGRKASEDGGQEHRREKLMRKWKKCRMLAETLVYSRHPAMCSYHSQLLRPDHWGSLERLSSVAVMPGNRVR